MRYHMTQHVEGQKFTDDTWGVLDTKTMEVMSIGKHREMYKLVSMMNEEWQEVEK